MNSRRSWSDFLRRIPSAMTRAMESPNASSGVARGEHVRPMRNGSGAHAVEDCTFSLVTQRVVGMREWNLGPVVDLLSACMRPDRLDKGLTSVRNPRRIASVKGET